MNVEITYHELLQVFNRWSITEEVHMAYWNAPRFRVDTASVVTQEDWEKVKWNPPEGTRWENHPKDPDADPRPPWSKVVATHRLLTFRGGVTDSGRALSAAEDIGVDAFANSRVPIDGHPLHVGGGIARMPALSYLAEAATLAGSPLHRAVLRRTDGEPVHLWTEASVRQLVGPLSQNRNLAENARNVIASTFQRDQAIFEDENGGLDASATDDEKFDAREAALARFQANVARYGELLAAAVAELSDPDSLPRDLITAREVFVERLEARAMARTKEIMKAASQQGVDRGFSCVDEERAAREIARQCVLGAIEIERAEDVIWKREAGAWAIATAEADLIAEPDHEGEGKPGASTGADGDTYLQTGSGIAQAKAAFNAAVAEIDAVEVLNVPIWAVNGAAVPGPTPASSVYNRTATVIARNPSAEIKGASAITAYSAGYVDGSGPVHDIAFRRLAVQGEPNAHAVFISLGASITKAVEMSIYAKNLCGPSRLELTIDPVST